MKAPTEPDRWRAVDVVLGAGAIIAIALHDAAHVVDGRYYDVFWVCNVSALLLGPGLLARSSTLVFVAFTWLVPGTIVWLLDVLVAGSSILPTSYAVHLGGSAAAIYGVARFGEPRRGWLAALATLVAAVLASRWLLPAEANVNAAHHVPPGWDFLGGSRVAFVLSVVILVLLLCAGAQAAARLIARPARAAGAAGSTPGSG